MIKNFSKIFALILTLIFSASYYTQTLTFSSTNPAVAPANVTLGSIKVPIYSAKIVASGFNGAGANLSSVSFTPTGTFLNSDITRYQFWYNTTNDLTTATNTGPDITAIPTQGTQVTLSPYNPYLGDGKTWYIWITADIKTSAVAGRTLTVGALTTGNFNFSSGTKTGTMFVGGTQTFGSDSDGDGVPDSTDLDDDNDGITDCDENLLGANASVSNVFSFVTAGTAIATSNNEVRLTQDTGNQAGRIWSVGKVDFTKSFVLRFDAYLGTRDNGADGIAAVFHNSPQGVNATGATGLGIGARGIANGIVLELDTYNNGTSLGDIPSDHGQIWDSDNQTSTGFLTTAIALPELENSTWHPVVINWNATTKTISYTVDGTNAGTYTGDLVTNYFAGANKVYFGYTASTGGATNEQKIRINSFCSDLPLEMDNDNDGIPNQLDTDSDGDGCADAIEGSENVTYSQIHALDLPVSDTNYAYRGQIKVKYDGVTTGSPSQIISTSAAANGVPQLLNNAGNNLNASTNPSNLAGTVDNTDGTADVGQGIGDSQNAAVSLCFIDAVNDINHTPAGTTLIGNVLTNDKASGAITVQSAMVYNSSGTLIPLVLGTPTLIYTSTGTSAGTMTLNTDGTYTFVPTTGFTGTVPVNYTAANTIGSTDTATLEIKVIPVLSSTSNNPPTAMNDTAVTELNTPVTSSVLNNDSDPDGNPLTVTATSQGATTITVGTPTQVSGVDANGVAVPNAGTLTLNSNGTYTFTPTTGFVGTVNPINYTISDGNGGTSSATIDIKVNPNLGNTVYANDDAKAIPKGTTGTGNVITNDTDPEGNTFTVTGATINGTALVLGTSTLIPGVGNVTLNSNGTYTFSPLATYVGTTNVVYTICDNATPTAACSTATLHLTSLDALPAYCYKLPVLNAGTTNPTKHGITALKRANSGANDWPVKRQSAWTVLEAKTKGFVVNRVAFSDHDGVLSTPTRPVGIPEANYVVGMMVYDTVANCLKIYNGTAWNCYTTPACPD